jgi:hypothetical protein
LPQIMIFQDRATELSPRRQCNGHAIGESRKR